MEALDRGPLRRISGRAVAANLPAHIPQRMILRTQESLTSLGVPMDFQLQYITAASAGAGIFLLAEYTNVPASFSAYGRRGKPSEAVADDAANAIKEHHASQAAIEIHLADQLLLPLSLAAGPSEFTVARPTSHLRTNAWTIGQFEVADISIIDEAPCRVQIRPRPRGAANHHKL
jgi:RNA 3'-terminal phosphate cyclase (ATP)